LAFVKPVIEDLVQTACRITSHGTAFYPLVLLQTIPRNSSPNLLYVIVSDLCAKETPISYDHHRSSANIGKSCNTCHHCCVKPVGHVLPRSKQRPTILKCVDCSTLHSRDLNAAHFIALICSWKCKATPLYLTGSSMKRCVIPIILTLLLPLVCYLPDVYVIQTSW
jgi:hypothetical protein